MKKFIIIPSFGTLSHILAGFFFFFYAPIHYKAEMKFCVFVCNSVCERAHAQKKRPTTSKFGTEIQEKVFEKASKGFFFFFFFL